MGVCCYGHQNKIVMLNRVYNPRVVRVLGFLFTFFYNVLSCRSRRNTNRSFHLGFITKLVCFYIGVFLIVDEGFIFEHLIDEGVLCKYVIVGFMLWMSVANLQTNKIFTLSFSVLTNMV